MKNSFLLFVCLLAAASTLQSAETIKLGLEDVELQRAVEFYETVTGKVCLLDPKLQGQRVTITTANNLDTAAAIAYMELSFKAHGLAFRDLDGVSYLESGKGLETERQEITKSLTLRFVGANEFLQVLAQSSGFQLAPTGLKQDAQMGPTSEQLTGVAVSKGAPSLRESAPVAGASSLVVAEIAPHALALDGLSCVVDPSTGAVLLRGRPERVEWAERIAETLDTRPLQVVVAVTIGEVSTSGGSAIGTDWQQALNDAASYGALQNAAGLAGAYMGNPVATAREASAVAQGLNLYYRGNRGVAAWINAQETRGAFKVLQRPVICALNHQRARIFTGQQVPIPAQTLTQSNGGAVGASVATSVQYVPVRLQLDVVPHAYDDGRIKLEFDQQNEGVGDYANIGGNQVPSLSEQGMRNTVIVKDGGVVVLGGLTTQSKQTASEGVPLLARIPLLGSLFGKRTGKESKRELVLLVEPQVVREAGALPSGLTQFSPTGAGTRDISALFGGPRNN